MTDGAHSLRTGGGATTVAELLARNGIRPARRGAGHAAPTPAEITVPIPLPRSVRGAGESRVRPEPTAYLPASDSAMESGTSPSPVPLVAKRTRHWKLATAGAAGVALAGAMLVGTWASGLTGNATPVNLADGHASAQEPQSGPSATAPAQPTTGTNQSATAPGRPTTAPGRPGESRAPAPDEGQFTGTLPVTMTDAPAPAGHSASPSPTTRAYAPTTTSYASEPAATPSSTAASPDGPKPSNHHDDPRPHDRDDDHPKNHDGGDWHHHR